MKLKVFKGKKNIATIIVALLIFSGCYYDNFEGINPAVGLINTCDTTSTVTYSKQVSTVFNGYCNSCHSSSQNNGNVSLDSYSSVINSRTRIVGSLRHQSGYKAMPPGTQIDECSIREIEMWLAAGALNN